MQNLGVCWELDGIFDEPFLAINVTNSGKNKIIKDRNYLKNHTLLKQKKTGDWDLRKSVVESNLKGRKIVLLFKEGKSRHIYVGQIKSIRQNGTNNNNEPRYEIEVCKNWDLVGQTFSTFMDFFCGFKVGSGDTYLWASVESIDTSSDINDVVDPMLNATYGFDKEGSYPIRVGHHIFVSALKKVWGVKCALTGLSAPRLVQACHIIPWKKALPHQKVSADNGLLLCAHLHSLFDENLIGFSREGDLLVDKKKLSKDLIDLIVIKDRTRLRVQPSETQARYLEDHAKKNLNLKKYK